ncbi:MAG: hypothetical protein OXQ90_05745 [Gammaproteobacteria bacterium]|nr:hypothetical protein [Gammaproteobacteria bacterium]
MSGGHFEYQESYIGYIAECLERDVRAFSGSATDDDRFSDESLEWYKEHGLTDRQVQALQVFAEELLEVQRVVRQYDLAMSGDTALKEGLQAVAEFVARRRSLPTPGEHHQDCMTQMRCVRIR